jgi:hypothetical protein
MGGPMNLHKKATGCQGISPWQPAIFFGTSLGNETAYLAIFYANCFCSAAFRYTTIQSKPPLK